MKKLVLSVLSVLLLVSCKQDDTSDLFVAGVSNPVINLNGIWKINTNPSGAFWEPGELGDQWKDLEVPGECMMQGVPIKHDQPFVYKKSIDIPGDFEDKIIMLQFDGVYSYARVWVNGNYVRDHTGGFTRWECDITSFVNPGESAMLIVEVTDKADEISYGSGYAKHQIGGILRDVHLLALPDNAPKDITIQTDFDENYQHASLIISGEMMKVSDHSKISLALIDPDHQKINLENATVLLDNRQSFQITNLINDPQKWDAEHPNLYSLKISMSENDKMLWQKVYQIGFREITLSGNKLLVNGSEIKLRGACRHDIHPLLGRVSTPEYEEMDVKLAKEANFNFIRTSHYPPTDNFLRLCDKYGLYVEDETAVCFVGSHRTEVYRPGATESDPDYTERYLSQLEEMVSSHKNHPSVIMWSIGNENAFGTNFKKSYDWVKENDNTRPVIFSYPGNVPDDIQSYEILSMHYPEITGNKIQYGKVTEAFGYTDMPVIFDEWAHVACYNNYTVKEDPNIRDFWGRSLDSMWQKTFNADGGLGGAIWGMIDETFMLPEALPGFNEWWGILDENVIPAEYSGNTIGYGEWGIVDTWRRKKPEFWNTKKAYSPVKLLNTTVENYVPGAPVSVPVYNRFDHTNFNELVVKYTYKNQVNTLKPADIKPHTKGSLSIPVDEWESHEPIKLEIYDSEDRLVDCYNLHIKSKDQTNEQIENSEIIGVEESETHLEIICENDTRIIFDKKTGLIHEIRKASDRFALSGPYLNIRTKGKSLGYTSNQVNDYSSSWMPDDFSFSREGNHIIVSVKGKYPEIEAVNFIIIISPDGRIVTKYHVTGIPEEYVREMGIKFELDEFIDSLSWKRDGYWSYYPAGHLSSHEGRTPLYSQIPNDYRKAPTKDWVSDAKSFYYDGTGNESAGLQLTHIAKATKENIRTYHLSKNGMVLLSVLGKGDIGCRIAKARDRIQLFVNNEMDYIDLSWGNYQRNIILNKNYRNEVVLRLNTHSDNIYQ